MCKVFNIEFGVLNIFLFKLLISKFCFIDKLKIEVFDKSLNWKLCYIVGFLLLLIDGKNEENILKSEESKEGYVLVSLVILDCRINMFFLVFGVRIKIF